MDKVRAGQGFNPCPLCGKYDGLEITSKDEFYSFKGEYGASLIYIKCRKCSIELWSHGCNSGHYTNHVGFLAERWNKLANTKQTEMADKDKLLDELREFLAKNVPDADIANRIYEMVCKNYTKESE